MRLGNLRVLLVGRSGYSPIIHHGVQYNRCKAAPANIAGLGEIFVNRRLNDFLKEFVSL